jgi:hypothetical protein
MRSCSRTCDSQAYEEAQATCPLEIMSKYN